MKIFIAPLNWGLGHASRCLPLIVRHLRAGDQVVLGGDGESLLLLRKHFPALRYYSLAPLQLRYSHSDSQVGAMLCALPRLLRFSLADHRRMQRLQSIESFDLIISDNRFGLFVSGCRTVYLTHQLHIAFPAPYRFLEPLAERLHARVIRRFSECWIPDNEGSANLSGRLSHIAHLPASAKFIGPLSRFEYVTPVMPATPYEVVAVLSGLEPQRTILENRIMEEYARGNRSVLIVRGKLNGPCTVIRKQSVALVPYLDDAALSGYLLSAQTIISRSGYSSIMDYAALGLFEKQKRGEVTLRLVPTPGQPEQEYLASRL